MVLKTNKSYMIVNFDDYLFEELLNESIINEEINYDKIKNIIGKIRDKKEAMYNLIRKFNETNNMHTRKYISTILILLFIGNMISKNSIWSDASAINMKPDIEKVIMNVSKQDNLNIKKIKIIAAPILVPEEQPEKRTLIKPNVENIIKPVDIIKVKTSLATKKFIKEHEKLRLEAYAIGDGMITIGYGHANYEKQSPYKVGDKITQEKANQLFAKDITRTEDGVKRMLLEWKKAGHNTKIDQNMFDALISMAYNMGIGGLRQSHFLNDLKNKNYYGVAEKIKNTKTTSRVKNEKGKWETIKMPGLIDRRTTESELFLKGVTI